jgi:carbohydrate kinase (thermoresistant glucokinase family)
VISVVLVAGVAGSGKTTIGGLLAGRLGWAFTDGDSLHSAANIAKMAAGLPLADEDRRPWLAAIAAWMDERIDAAEPAVMACSALKRRYRDQLLGGRPAAAMAFLLTDRETVARRLSARPGHFLDPRLTESQFAALEPPSPDEIRVISLRLGGRVTPAGFVTCAAARLFRHRSGHRAAGITALRRGRAARPPPSARG